MVAVRAGKNEGAKTVLVMPEIFSKKKLEMEGPDLIPESFNSIADFLK